MIVRYFSNDFFYIKQGFYSFRELDRKCFKFYNKKYFWFLFQGDLVYDFLDIFYMY